MGTSLKEKLVGNRLREELASHPLFEIIDRGDADRSLMAAVVGQWWHPLHYFPDFMAGSIRAMPSIEAKSFLASILNEETGEGVAEQAHEKLFFDTMKNAGFSEEEICGTAATAETQKLVDGYRDSVTSTATALGYVYGTEVVDLIMVSKVGAALTRLSPGADLPWVDIHIQQEPNHVQQADRSIDIPLDDKESEEFVQAAEAVWMQWFGMFDSAVREGRSALQVA